MKKILNNTESHNWLQWRSCISDEALKPAYYAIMEEANNINFIDICIYFSINDNT